MVLDDEDDGLAEALLRDAELDENPELGISLEQLDQQLRRSREPLDQRPNDFDL